MKTEKPTSRSQYRKNKKRYQRRVDKARMYLYNRRVVRPNERLREAIYERYKNLKTFREDLAEKESLLISSAALTRWLMGTSLADIVVQERVAHLLEKQPSDIFPPHKYYNAKPLVPGPKPIKTKRTWKSKLDELEEIVNRHGANHERGRPY